MPSPTRVSGGRAPKLDFPVTAEMIETAIPQDSAHCMIADGLRAALPEARQIAVDLATIRFTDPHGRRLIYLTPVPAQVALLDFDHGEKPGPFRVHCHAAQIIEAKPKKMASPSLTGTGESPASPSLSPTPESVVSPSLTGTPSEPTDAPSERSPRQRATLIPNPAGGGTVPIKFGGSAPPLGPLARGVGTNKTGPKYRTGRKRGFGLRVMGH